MSCSLPDNNGALSGACPVDVSPVHIHYAILDGQAVLDWMGNVLLPPTTVMAASSFGNPDSALGELHSAWAHFKPLFFSEEANQTQLHISNPKFYSHTPLSGTCTALI